MGKWPEWFTRWQQQFYHSKRWIALRDQVREDARMRCSMCGRLVKGKGIVDHIAEITPENFADESLTLAISNLRYLCLECHNEKTFGSPSIYAPELRREVNLF